MLDSKDVKCGCSEEIQCRQYKFACSVLCACQGATGVSMIQQDRLSRPMMLTMAMMTTRCDGLLFILVMTGTIKVYFHIYESILCIFLDVTSTICTTGSVEISL